MTMTITVSRETDPKAACCTPIEVKTETAACCAEASATDALLSPDDADAIKAAVQSKYGAIAEAAAADGGCGCGSLSVADAAYPEITGYLADADLQLGCGLPTEHANLQPGQTVLDLGSGAGLDAFIARQIVGETGTVLGVDLTPAMVARARENAEKLGYDNVRFLQGDLEAMPLPAASVDVVVSNCVLNLVPDKTRAFAEMERVLREGGHFCVSDIVSRGELPDAIRRSAELYVGCVAGAMDESDYLAALEAAGFQNVRIVQDHLLDLPDEALKDVVPADVLAAYRASGTTLASITVYGEKPA